MSDLFLKNTLESMISPASELTNYELPQFITIYNQDAGSSEHSETSSNVLSQLNNNLSATSSENLSQMGGNNLTYSATSTINNKNNDVNQLVSMLTSDSSNNALSETSTASLEVQLRNMLKSQNGGAPSNHKTSISNIKSFFNTLKNEGVNVNIKLNDQTMSEFFDDSLNTTTELVQDGGRGMNPVFAAMLEVRKHVSNKLNIKNGPDAAKVAGAVLREVREKNPSINNKDLAKVGKKHFDDNESHFKSML